MDPSSKDNPEKKWYKHPMVWLIITFPTLAVIGGIVTINLAIISNDGLVEDDYYKQGMAINQKLQRDKYAQELKLYAQSVLTDDLFEIKMQGNLTHWPQRLVLHVRYPTRSGIDQQVIMTQVAPQTYKARLKDKLVTGAWKLEISTETWRIRGKMQWPEQTQAVIH